MQLNINTQQKQSKTIEYILNLVKQLQSSKSQPQSQDSLAVSQQNSKSISFNLIFDNDKSKSKSKNNKKYISPYNKNTMSINKIQKSNKKRQHEIINFQNKVLKQINHKTSREKKKSNRLSSTQRYIKINNFKDKVQDIQLDKIKAEAKQIYEKQTYFKRQMSPLKSKQVWSDFLLRSRRWQAEKQQKKFLLKNKYRQNIYQKSISPRKPATLNNDELIQMFRRNKLKLQERLKQITPQLYKNSYKHNQKIHRSKPKHIKLSHSMQLDFLNSNNKN